jgi:hypothetical protein
MDFLTADENSTVVLSHSLNAQAVDSDEFGRKRRTEKKE